MRASDRRQHVKWLGQYRWRLWAVFTFRPGIRMKSARLLFRKWIYGVEMIEDRKLSWMAFPERGDGDNLHFHVLLAGIGSRIYNHARQWNALAGHCHILKYDPSHPGRDGQAIPSAFRGMDYAMKSLRNDDYFFDGELHDMHLLPRFRKVRR